MRTLLFPISSTCSKQMVCGFCRDLGYRSRTTAEASVWRNSATRLPKSLETSVLLPCSSSQSDSYPGLIAELESTGVTHKHLFFSDLWLELPEAQKNALDLKNVAVFFTATETLLKSTISQDVHLYFLILKRDWNWKKWAALPATLRGRLKVYFPPNTCDHDKYFTADEAYDLAERIQSLDPHVRFETPFGHDLKDLRNEEHFKWFFSQSPKWKTEVSSRVKISIVIPTYNRSRFIQRVITALSAQTLARTEFEILVLDDGGSDQTGTALKASLAALPALNVSYFYIKRDIALKDSYVGNRAGPIRNLGVKWAKGKYLLFLDSDILMPRTYLESVLRLHAEADVVLPIRIYLSKEASARVDASAIAVQSDDILITPWQFYLEDFYRSGDWAGQETPWKYFMTYCLSVSKDLFLAAGGFRTNYISYGYEDLDFGYRMMRLNPRLHLYKENVYHIFHFDDASSEYGLSQDFRKFQLAMTSRMFVFQNVPIGFPYLKDMIRLKSLRQRFIYFWFRLRWGLRTFIQDTRLAPKSGKSVSEETLSITPRHPGIR